MDDGAKSNSGYILNTQCFSLEDQHILVDILSLKFKLQVNIHKDRELFRLYITSKSRDSFASTQLVKPYIFTGTWI